MYVYIHIPTPTHTHTHTHIYITWISVSMPDLANVYIITWILIFSCYRIKWNMQRAKITIPFPLLFSPSPPLLMDKRTDQYMSSMLAILFDDNLSPVIISTYFYILYLERFSVIHLYSIKYVDRYRDVT